MKFTLKRKVVNLKIALTSVANRYADWSDSKCFDEFIKNPKQNTGEIDLKFINGLRRKYHYNYLYMSEAFIKPNDDVIKTDHGKLANWLGNRMEDVRKNLFYIPFWMAVFLTLENILFFIYLSPRVVTPWEL